MSMMISAGSDKANAEFWDELCGSNLARSLGITDASPTALARFDEAYLDFYPYLLKRVKPARMAGRRVLEVGLGYGTLSQKIAESGAHYTGLDIAEGPVKMVKHRLRMTGIPGATARGSMLDAPFADSSFKYVVAIGCFHHTGDVQRCIDETYRLLEPGGIAVLMVYNRFSLRQWIRWPGDTCRAMIAQLGQLVGGRRNRVPLPKATESQRRAYDESINGKAAPETVFLSITQLRQMFSRYSRVQFHMENFDTLTLKGHTLLPRRVLLPSVARAVGLDIYIEARK